MSSTKDKIRDWFFSLPEDTRNPIDDQIERIRNQEDVTERHQQTLTKMVKELARMLEQLIDDPSQTSIIIKTIGDGRISDDTIERALPEDKKRKHKPYETYRQLEQNRVSDFQDPETVTVSTSGSQSITGPEGNEKEDEQEIPMPSIASEQDIHNGIAEASAEIALTTINTLRDELIEKIALLDDKDRRIEELELERGNFEIELGNLKDKPVPKNVDQLEELQIQLDEAKQTIEEYREIERLRVQKQDFQTASKVESPPMVWVAAINAMNLFKGLKEGANHAIDHNEPWRKVVFDVALDGQLKNARLEEKSSSAEQRQ